MTINSIKHLPLEVLTRIVYHLEYERHTLHQLASVSRTFHKLATLFLCSCYQQPYQCDAEATNQLQFYVRTILSNPILASHVKHVCLYDITNARDRDTWPERSEELTNLFEEHVESLCSQLLEVAFGVDREFFSENWQHFLRLPEPDSIYILLLCHLPNLETLFWGAGDHNESFLMVLDAVASIPTSSKIPRPLLKLQSIRLWAGDEAGGYDFPDLIALFCRLPSVRKMELVCANSGWRMFYNPEGNVNVQRSNVEVVSFQATGADIPIVHALVESCAALKEFHCTYQPLCFTDVPIYPQQLLDELLQQANNLEMLHVNYDDDIRESNFGPDDTEIALLTFNKDLVKLENLRHLATNYTIMFGDIIHERGSEDEEPPNIQRSPDFRLCDYLPPNLEHFEVFSCDPSVISHLQDLAEARKRDKSFNELRRVRLHFVKGTDKKNLTPVDMVGVEVEYVIMGQPGGAESLVAIPGCMSYKIGKKDTSLIFSDNPLMQFPGLN